MLWPERPCARADTGTLGCCVQAGVAGGLVAYAGLKIDPDGIIDWLKMGGALPVEH